MTVLGVVGAGTMGAGIAQLGAAAGFRTLLHDPDASALERGTEGARRGLAKWAEKGRTDENASNLLEPVSSLDELAPCDLVIEAAPERAELKRDLFGALSLVCGDDVVLATNTSSIPVTSLAGAAARPEKVVGMHFFNPPPLMPLLEVIRADQSADEVVERAIEVGRAMGKEVIVAADGPGFLVNRCGRPFSGEGLRLLAERVATHDQIDRICRLGGGFRMGPFELMDLVGVDVGFEVAKSFAELSFGEPRWQPSPIQARMVAAGRLGRKSGRGYYEYADGQPYRQDDPEPRAPGSGDADGTATRTGPATATGTGPATATATATGPAPGSLLAVLGDGALADQLRERARAAGYELREGGPTELVLDARLQPQESPPGGAPVGVLCASSSLAARGEPGAVGFYAVPDARLVELTRLPGTQNFAADALQECFEQLGYVTEWVDDAPGLVLGRIVCQLVNEAAFAIGEGVGSAEDVDTGLRLGLSHPRGPVEWSEAIGLEHVVAVLDALWEERREERYRTAPLLRRAAALGRSLRDEWPRPT